MKPTRFVNFVGLMAVLAAAGLWTLAPPAADWNYGTVAVLALVAITAEVMTFLLPRGAMGSIAFIPYIATIMLVPNFAALVAIVGVRMIIEITRKSGALKFVFNTSQVMFTYAIAIELYRISGGRSLLDLRHLPIADVTVAVGLPMMLSYVFSFVMNAMLVSHVIALTTNGRTLQVWRENCAATVGIDILATPLVFAFAYVYANFGPIVASILWIPLLGVRQLNTINLELAQTNRELLELMVKSMEARDPYTSGHSRRVKEYAIKIAKLMGLSPSEIEKIGTAALLHDVGKIYDKYGPILAKADRLSPEEWAIIKEHPADGANLVATMTRLRELVPAVRHHHENWDGTGYPDALRGEEIPLASRVIMFADTFDAMTTKRPYRGPLGEDDVRAEVLRYRGRQFDPEIADRLLASDFWRTLFPPIDRAMPTPRFMQVVAGGSKK
jgi:putative nucleotidyltransferase with HDIG domain